MANLSFDNIIQKYKNILITNGMKVLNMAQHVRPYVFLRIISGHRQAKQSYL